MKGFLQAKMTNFLKLPHEFLARLIVKGKSKLNSSSTVELRLETTKLTPNFAKVLQRSAYRAKVTKMAVLNFLHHIRCGDLKLKTRYFERI